jgi:hypothetical protein
MDRPGKTLMTEQDMRDAVPLAEKIVELLAAARPPTAVAASAFALAAISLLAKCGPDAPAGLFKHYYRTLDQMQREDRP